MQMPQNTSPPEDSARSTHDSRIGVDRQSNTTAEATRPRSRWHVPDSILLTISLVVGGIAHGYHMFLYPLYITDEGIYMEQAWSVLREGRLSPYTYYYDHAPAGWLTIAGWAEVLPRQFETFGDAINSGRLLMLLVHLANIYLLYIIVRRLSGSSLAAFVATFLFNLSPLAVFYQRQVLLDNLMVFWVLLSLYLATSNDQRVVTPMLSGLALGIGVLTKENAIFFAPIIGYLLYNQVREQKNRRFALGFGAFVAVSTISLYFLYASLKNELLPTKFNFSLSNPPADHVALLYTMWYQVNRSQGSILDPNSLFWRFSLGAWLPKDTFILAAGTVAMLANLIIGWGERKRDPGYLVASVLGLSYAFYLVRGSVMLEFYVVPLVPFLAMNIGMLLSRIVRGLPNVGQGAVVALMFAALACPALVSPIDGYVFKHDSTGKVVLQDLYNVPLTPMQTEQIAYIRQHIPPDARIIMDDDMWVDLHDVRPYYKWAHSHWKAAADPAVRDKLFQKNWENVDYIVMSNKMLTAMQQNNTNGQEDWILAALDHSQRIWSVHHGDVELAIYQVQH